MSYTQDQYLILSQLAYIDLERAGSQMTIAEMSEYFHSNNGVLPNGMGGLSNEQYLCILETAANDPALRDMRLVAYSNQNVTAANPNGNGLVAYAFEAPGGDRVFAFRGSEGNGSLSGADWDDNFGLLRGDSPQNRDAIAFAEANKASPPYDNYATGHSLGGSNAMAVAGALGMGGAVFNARGVAPNIVSEYGEAYFQQNLDDNGFRSIRAAGDVVSSLDHFAWHPKNEEIVPGIPFDDEHGARIMPVPPELADKIAAFYDEVEKLVYRDPVLKKLLADILLNDLGGKIKDGDILSILKALGYAPHVLKYLPVLEYLFIKYGDVIAYLVTTQNGASQRNIFTPHYTQTLEDPSRGCGCGGDQYFVCYGQLRSSGEGLSSVHGLMAGFSDQLKAVAAGMEWYDIALLKYKACVSMSSSRARTIATKSQKCADAALGIHDALLAAEQKSLQSISLASAIPQ